MHPKSHPVLSLLDPGFPGHLLSLLCLLLTSCPLSYHFHMLSTNVWEVFPRPSKISWKPSPWSPAFMITCLICFSFVFRLLRSFRQRLICPARNAYHTTTSHRHTSLRPWAQNGFPAMTVGAINPLHMEPYKGYQRDRPSTFIPFQVRCCNRLEPVSNF